MQAFIFQNWHAWPGQSGLLLSDENTKELRQFPDVDQCINWLFLKGHKAAARALNAHAKGAA